MPGHVIGASMGRGFPGTISRSIDAIVEPHQNVGAAAIEFGTPVSLKSDGTGVLPWANAMTADNFTGVAVREVKTEATYGTGDAKYGVGELVDVLVRGSITVKCTMDATATTEPVKGAKVYIRKATGVFVAASESTATVELSGVIWAQNGVDADGAAEITILERKA